MSKLKEIESLVNLLDDNDPLKKLLSEIHQTLERFCEWFEKKKEPTHEELRDRHPERVF